MILLLYCLLLSCSAFAAVATEECNVLKIFPEADKVEGINMLQKKDVAKASSALSGDLSLRNVTSADRVVHMFNFSDTLQQEVEHFRDIAVTVSGGGHGNIAHFFHTVRDLAFPIYAKMVLPFVMGKHSLPRRRIHLPNAGGTSAAALLQQMIPDFDFVNSRWVPYCWLGDQCIKTLPRRRLDIPLFTLDSDTFQFLNGHVNINHVRASAKQSANHRQLVLDFRSYVLKQVPPSASRTYAVAPTRLFLSRSTAARAEASINIGARETGAERRCIANERDLLQAINDEVSHRIGKTRGITMLQLEGIPFAEQVATHRKAKLLIGQHGAGLLHCLWMPKDGSVVEITTSSLRSRAHFKYFCSAVRGLDYRSVVVPDNSNDADVGNNVTVPVAMFMDEIRDLLVE